jgi:predicted RND superfamily exporter protein
MTFKSRNWLWLLALIPIAIGLARLRFDVEVLDLLPKDSPVVNGLKIYQEKFSYSRELYVTVSSSNAETTESAARALAEKFRSASNLVSQATWQPPWLESPLQAAELVAAMWLNQRPEIFGELTNRLGEKNLANTLEETRERLATSISPSDLATGGYDPFGLLKLPDSVSSGASSFGTGNEMFASSDGKFHLVFVEAKPELKNYRDCAAWLAQIKSLVEKLRETEKIPSSIQIGFTGSPAFISEIAGGMQHDMTASVGLTALIIAILFWIAHRRILPMIWLLVLLALILLSTLALGGLIFGTINVVSLGFAGILLGLAVDYGVVHYQEAMAKPSATVPEIRRAIRPSIIWAAVTTISAFLVLNFSGLPGLGQLGSIVAIGIALSAIVMLFVFLPPLFRDRMRKRAEQTAAGIPPETHEEKFFPTTFSPKRKTLFFGFTSLLVAVVAIILSRSFPKMDRSPDALRPRNSPSYAAIEQMKNALGKSEDPLWIIIRGPNETEVAQRLNLADAELSRAASNGWIASYNLPTPLWPQPKNQIANRPAIRQLLGEEKTLRDAALAEGFASNSLALTETIFNTWSNAVSKTNIFWPTNPVSRWALDKATARSSNELFAIGLAYPAGENSKAVSENSKTLFARWPKEFANEGILLSGWSLLGSSMFDRVQNDFARVVLPMIFLVLLSLWLAFRKPKEILLSLAVLCLSGFCLLATMSLVGWSWNLLNFMALPLMLGTGVDYSIFMQLALRRHNGNLPAAYQSVGRALLLCGGTAVAGFASLSLSSNAGMASLGQVCAVGIGFNMLISVYLLPVWWRSVTPTQPATR